MPKYVISLYEWEVPRVYNSEVELEKGDKVIIESEIGPDIGVVESEGLEVKENPVKNILRKATERDIDVSISNQEKVNEILKVCKSEIKRLMLEMKLVGARIAIDGNSAMIFFTAEGRVDFRELVKNLSKIFQKSIRMQQIGSRDEARKLGGCGICGRELCCVKFSGSLPSISTDMARIQRVAHKGSERISGLCGRLMCCLAYEFEQYRELLKGMPEIHSIVKTEKNKGEVIEINAIKGEIKIKTEANEIITIKKEDLK